MTTVSTLSDEAAEPIDGAPPPSPGQTMPEPQPDPNPASGARGTAALVAVALLALGLGFAAGRIATSNDGGQPLALDDLAATARADAAGRAEKATLAAPQPVAAAPDTAGLSVGLVEKGVASIGEPAPDFTLLQPDGEALKLSDFIGRPILINFWATWCRPCEVEMPLLQAAWEDHGEAGLVIIGLDYLESAELVASYVEAKGLTFPIALDGDGAVSEHLYRVGTLPTSVLVARDGTVAHIRRGLFASHDDLEQQLRFIIE